jgi:hypothetical protein
VFCDYSVNQTRVRPFVVITFRELPFYGHDQDGLAEVGGVNGVGGVEQEFEVGGCGGFGEAGTLMSTQALNSLIFRTE